ncbi:MAG: PEP-utilizing enzyme [Patescibacteria group bacterium]
MSLYLHGLPASRGIAEGTVKIISGIQDAEKFHDGDILVAKITDPTMVFMMGKAAGIVCDIGGIMSHPSIVSREMGIPCVVNTKDATKILKDGMRVRVDGEKGTVEVLS